MGALYNGNGAVVETKIENENLAGDFTRTITFKNNPSDYTLKVFIWNGADENGMKPMFDTAAAVRPGKK